MSGIDSHDMRRLPLGFGQCNGAILSEPQNIDDARRMLRLLGGRQHDTLSGLCLHDIITNETRVEVERTILYVHAMSDAALEAYLASHQWEGKAGAFGYQDGLDWLEIVEGSESNVVGLPLELLERVAGAEVRGSIP